MHAPNEASIMVPTLILCENQTMTSTEREELACMPYPAHGYLLDELRKQTIRPCMRDNGFQERVEAARQRYAFRRALRGKVEDCRADADETQRDEGASRISHSCRPSSDRASSLQGFIDLL